MTPPREIVVVELGSAVFRAVRATGEGGFRVLAYEETPSRGVRRGVPHEPDEAGRALDGLLRRLGEPPSVSFVLPGAAAENHNGQGLRQLTPKGRAVSTQDVLEAIRHSRTLGLPPDREIVQTVPRAFRVDGLNVPRPVGTPGSRLEVDTLVVATDADVLGRFESALSVARVEVEDAVSGVLAAGTGVLTSEELAAGTVVVDLGAQSTTMGVFREGSLRHAASVPFGGDTITSDVSKLLKTSPDDAERMKIAHGSADPTRVPEADLVEVRQLGNLQPRPMPRRVLAEIIEARVRETAALVVAEVERPLRNGGGVKGVVLTGGGAQLAGSAEIFARHLGDLPFRVAQPDLGVDLGLRPGGATVVGAARFLAQCDEELTTSASTSWRDKFRIAVSFFGR